MSVLIYQQKRAPIFMSGETAAGQSANIAVNSKSGINQTSSDGQATDLGVNKKGRGDEIPEVARKLSPPKRPYYEAEIEKPDFQDLIQRSTLSNFLAQNGEIDPASPRIQGVPMFKESNRMAILSASSSGNGAGNSILKNLLLTERQATANYEARKSKAK